MSAPGFHVRCSQFSYLSRPPPFGARVPHNYKTFHNRQNDFLKVQHSLLFRQQMFISLQQDLLQKTFLAMVCALLQVTTALLAFDLHPIPPVLWLLLVWPQHPQLAFARGVGISVQITNGVVLVLRKSWQHFHHRKPPVGIFNLAQIRARGISSSIPLVEQLTVA